MLEDCILKGCVGRTVLEGCVRSAVLEELC